MVKGIVYTIEAVIGALLVLLGMMIIFPIQRQSTTGLSETGYFCLEYMDIKGTLRHYAVNDTSELNNSLRNCLPASTDFAYKVCSSSDCIASVPVDRDVYATSYLIAGENSYNRLLINLWIWFK
jgi:hypothetical protein